MKKQFKTGEELSQWAVEKFGPKTFEEVVHGTKVTEAEIANQLVAEGYDLDNLTSDNYAYRIDGHTNHGRIWRDESELAKHRRTSHIDLRGMM